MPHGSLLTVNSSRKATNAASRLQEPKSESAARVRKRIRFDALLYCLGKKCAYFAR
jgi:hypothetical protein